MHQRFECEVVHRGTLGAGTLGALDPAYRAMSRERFAAAAQRTRTVQTLKDTRLVGATTTVQIGQKRKQTEDKRVANMTPEQLTAALFRLFERQPRWSFAQLQRDTAQPTAPLKAALLEVAAKNVRGPYKVGGRVGGWRGGGPASGGGENQGARTSSCSPRMRPPPAWQDLWELKREYRTGEQQQEQQAAPGAPP